MTDNRLTDTFDAVLHLLDRQVQACDDLAVCKVDDVELTEAPDGTLTMTGLLSGAAVLLPRFGRRSAGRLKDFYERLGVVRADRSVPLRIDLDLVERVDSAVRLTVPRNGVLVVQEPAAEGHRLRRLGDLLRMSVGDTDGGSLGRILDVRVEPDDASSDLRVVGFIVGRGRPGGTLGYDRRAVQGPWLLDRLVGWLHRRSRFVPWSDVTEVDWERSLLTVTAADRPPLREL